MSAPDPLPSGDVERMAALRRELHASPEASGREEHTAARMRALLADCGPRVLIDRLGGGHGLAAVFEAPDAGPEDPTIALRAELDAVPVEPGDELEARFRHACGHDGHLAMLGGVALDLARRPLRRGRVVLLCQAAEETGQGARAVAADPRWLQLQANHVFALHNLPGYPLGRILLRSGPFTAGSVGMIISLRGRAAHAAYPERGLSPAHALSRLVPALVGLPIPLEAQGQLALVTVVHARLGDEAAFGTSPAEARIMATLRADRPETLAALRDQAGRLARREAEREGLSCTVAWVEEFPVTINAEPSVRLARRAAAVARLEVTDPDESPFRWSEDFGWLLQEMPGALVGIGSGVDQPVLHAADFEFPDALLPLGARFYAALLSELGMR